VPFILSLHGCRICCGSLCLFSCSSFGFLLLFWGVDSPAGLCRTPCCWLLKRGRRGRGLNIVWAGCAPPPSGQRACGYLPHVEAYHHTRSAVRGF
jgi:hypothetical protein